MAFSSPIAMSRYTLRRLKASVVATSEMVKREGGGAVSGVMGPTVAHVAPVGKHLGWGSRVGGLCYGARGCFGAARVMPQPGITTSWRDGS